VGADENECVREYSRMVTSASGHVADEETPWPAADVEPEEEKRWES
jgi:hypothetical protein